MLSAEVLTVWSFVITTSVAGETANAPPCPAPARPQITLTFALAC